MAVRNHAKETLGASDFAGSLGGSHDVEFTSNRYTREVLLTVNLGTAYDSEGGTQVSWDGDAEERFFEGVKLNINGEIFEIPSEYINFLNTYNQGIEQSDQIVVGLRVPFTYKGQRIMTGAIKGSEWSTAKLELDTRTVSDLTSGNGSYQEGTEVEVTTKEATIGSTAALPKINDKVNTLANGSRQYEFRQDGVHQFLVIEDVAGDLEHVNVEAILPSDEAEVVDMSATALRRKNIRQSGTPNLPSGYYFVDLAEEEEFDKEDVERLEANLEGTGSGEVVFYHTTVKQV